MSAQTFNTIFLSPHADDVGFAASLAVAEHVEKGERVAVITLFESNAEAGPAFADGAARLEEDRRFCALVGATHVHLGFPDAARRDPRYRNPRRLFRQPPLELPETDAQFLRDVRAKLVPYFAEDVTLYAPLAVGSHVDHELAHQLAWRLRVKNRWFYEDSPYLLTPGALSRRLDALGAEIQPMPRAKAFLHARARFLAMPFFRRQVPRLLLPFAATYMAYAVTQPGPRARPREAISRLISRPQAREQKRAALASYPSQWPLFYDSIDAWLKDLAAYAATLGKTDLVEQVWSFD